jgi:hypothetical protein
VDALVVDRAAFLRALQARYLVLRLLSPFAWFRGAKLALKRDGRVVLVAVTTPPTDPEQRAAVLARVASHLGGVQLEGVVGGPATASPSWRPREPPGTPARADGER